MKLYAKLESLLKEEPNFLSDDGKLKKWVVIDKARNFDSELISLLLKEKQACELFFVKVNEVLVFNQNLFIQFLEQKKYLNDSYTQYKNKVGLTIGGKHLKQRNEVFLEWPFKDCVLEGGQSREEQKREEIFFNEIWGSGDYETKVTVQKLIFPKGIVINPVEREYRTSDLNPIFRLIHSFTGDDGDRNKKRTGRNTDPSCLVAGTGLEPVTFGL